MKVLFLLTGCVLVIAGRWALQSYLLREANRMGIAFTAGPLLGMQYEYGDGDSVQRVPLTTAHFILGDVDHILRVGGYHIVSKGNRCFLAFSDNVWPEDKEPIPHELTAYIICNRLYYKDVYPNAAPTTT